MVFSRLHTKRFAAFMPLAAFLLAPSLARAADALGVGAASVDPPTLVSLGVQLLITDDDNGNAAVAVRYREQGSAAFRQAYPLSRVHPENSPEIAIAPEFAGSIVDLRPGTTYEIELHATDPDGPVDKTLMLTATTRAVPPAEPKAAAVKPVSDAASLNSALNNAQPGDVITLGDGVYSGNFAISASGTADNPIVIRGASRDGAILDGGGCQGCNVLEVYGSFVHVERLTIQNASRGLRFQGTGAEENVVRGVRLTNVTLGIGSKPDQKNFYICDNLLEGRLTWPAIYADDGGQHANDDGINLEGAGHVICHNDLIGFGDAMKIGQDAAVSVDVYGNEVRSAYDNAFEFDGSLRNVRAFRNRFTNVYAPISFQPVHGGPVYAFRNVVVNVVDEQMKFHGLGAMNPQEPNGVLVFHNTFIGANTALNVQTPAASHHFALMNNIFIGPDPVKTKVVDWGGVIDDGVFENNGYAPDGPFTFHPPGGYQNYASFAEAQAGGWEKAGLILGGAIFASGIVAPQDYKQALAPADVSLDKASAAVDRGAPLPNFNDNYQGAAPDLGALERGCEAPIYGIRPPGVDDATAPPACGGGSGGAGGNGSGSGAGGESSGAGGGGGASSGSGGGSTDDSGGCGCRAAGSSNTPGMAAAILMIGLFVRSRRGRRVVRR